MQKKTISEIEEEYNLELERIEKEVKKSRAKRVLLQFPDGMKPYSTTIAQELEKRTNNKVEFLIWLSSCFGACDTPNIPSSLKVDLVIQFGHSKWKKDL